MRTNHLFLLGAIGLTMLAVSCGPSAAEKRLDHIQDSLRMADSIAKAEAEAAALAEQARLDSTKNDSIVGTAVPEQDRDLILSNVRDIYTYKATKYFTPEFQKVMDDADDKARKEGDEIGYFGCDILTNSQDPGDFKRAKILETIGEDLAKVKVYGENYGENLSEDWRKIGSVTITVKLLDGKYYVDDVIGLDGKSVKKDAQRFLLGK